MRPTLSHGIGEPGYCRPPRWKAPNERLAIGELAQRTAASYVKAMKTTTDGAKAR